MTRDQLVLVCAGLDYTVFDSALYSCLQYNLAQEAWDHHSNLRYSRTGAAVATLADGSYIMGDRNNFPYSSEFLPVGSSNWTEGPGLPWATKDACGVEINETSLLLISEDGVEEYSTNTRSWSTWPSLALGRSGHACIKTGHLVLVAGGTTEVGGHTPTTEVINLETKIVSQAGDMDSPRIYFGMFRLGYNANSVLITFGNAGPDTSVNTGGEGSGPIMITTMGMADPDSLLQEFNPTTSTWRPSPAVMDPRAHFSAVTVEASLVCKPGEI